MQDVDLAYLAGMIDADGCITIQRMVKTKHLPSGNSCVNTYYALKVTIMGTRLEPLQLAQEIFGSGAICTYVPPNGYLPQHQWNICGPTAQRALSLLLPYLRIKRKQGELGIAFQGLMASHKAEMRAEQKPPYRITEKMQAERDQLWRAMTSLNMPTNRRKYMR